MFDYTTISTHSDRESDGANALRTVVRQIVSAVDKMEHLGAYKGDMRFRNEALSVFKQHKANLEAEFTVYKNGKINVRLQNQNNQQIEQLELIPFGQTILRQVSF